jgi:hypothetical protein
MRAFRARGDGAALAPARAHDVTLDVSANVVFGHSLNVTGAVAPAEHGLTVTVEQKSPGVWTDVATVTTDAAGAYAASFAPTTGGPLRARLDDGSLSPEQPLKVRPAVSLSFGPARAFLGAHLPAEPIGRPTGSTTSRRSANASTCTNNRMSHPGESPRRAMFRPGAVAMLTSDRRKET